MSIDDYVAKYGEEYRELIIDALRFLEERKNVWNVKSFDEQDYISSLIARYSGRKEQVDDL